MAPTKHHSSINWRARKPYATLGRRQQCAIRKKYRVANRTLERIRNVQQAIQRTARTQNEESRQILPVDELLLQEPTARTTNFEPRQNEAHRFLHEPPAQEHTQNFDLGCQQNLPAENIPNTTNTASETERQVDCNDLNFPEKLAHAFLSTGMNHVQSTRILRVLKTHPCHSDLPSDSRTLLKTPRTSPATKIVEPGEYLHIGLEVALVEILSQAKDPLPDEVDLDLHADGAELYKKISIWPLQFRCINIPSLKKFIGIIGIYRGRSQPNSAQDFLESLVDEFQNIESNGGILFEGKKIRIRFRFCIADAKARAFLLGHTSCTSRKPCSKCHVKMYYYVAKRKRKIKGFKTYCGVKHKRRTDATYVLRNDKFHHYRNSSPLESLNIGLVSQVPFEYMHLVLIGEMKKLCSAWIDGEHRKTARFSKEQTDLAAENFREISKCIPSEFARKPSVLCDYSSFKATEFRQILLFTGPTFLYGVLNENMYIHFLFFHCAIRCLVYYAKSELHLRFADIALNKYVGGCESIYSKSIMSYNSHGLLHLVEDVRTAEDDLDSFSAFPYESNMMLFRQLCRSPNKPLQQIAKRLAEKSYYQKTAPTDDLTGIRTSHLRHRNDESGTKYFDNIKTSEFSLSTKSPNNCVKVNNDVFIIGDIILQNDVYSLQLYKYGRIEEFYNVGISSIDVGIFLCSNLQTEFTTVRLDDVTKKCFCQPLPKTDVTYEICDNIFADCDQYVVVEM